MTLSKPKLKPSIYTAPKSTNESGRLTAPEPVQDRYSVYLFIITSKQQAAYVGL